MKTFAHDGCRPRVRMMPGADFAALRCYDGGGGGQATTESASSQGTTTGNQSPQSAGATSPINQGAQQVVAGGNVQFQTSTDPQAFQAIQNIIGAALNTSGQTQQAITQAQVASNDALNSVLDKVTSADQKIAANTASGGATQTNQTLIYVVLAALAGVVGLGLLNRRKS